MTPDPQTLVNQIIAAAADAAYAAGADAAVLLRPDLQANRMDSTDRRAPRTPLVQTAYGELGGRAAIAALIDRTFDLVLNDPTLWPYFVGVNLDRLKHHLLQMLIFLTDGPDDGQQPYDLATAHTHLRVAPGHYIRLVSYLWEAAYELAVPDKIVKHLLCVAVDLKPLVTEWRTDRA